MTILIRSTRHSAAELISELDPRAPATWPRVALPTAWGCVAWAGEQVEIVDGWLILGLPSVDPWGWPGRPMEKEDLASRLSLFGPDAVRTATGPFLVLALRDGNVTRPGNGIVPFWTSDDVGSSCQELAGPGAAEQAPLADTGHQRNTRTILNGRRVRDELLEHRPIGTPRQDSLVPRAGDPVWSRGFDAPTRLRAVRRKAPGLWWSGRLDGRWVHAPALERPVVDRLLEIGS